MTTSLLNVPLATLQLGHILNLLAEEKTELKQLEYKRELPPSREEIAGLRKSGLLKDNKDPIVEFACDVSAMANSEGGDILFGVDEDTLNLAPIEIGDWDKTRSRLEQLILSNIEPRLIAFDFRPVEVTPGKFLVILRVPKSLIGPHQISSGRDKFWMRHPGGKHPMDIAQIRAAFLSSATAIDSARRWRDERFDKLLRNDGHLQLEQGPIQILHLIPLSFRDPMRTISIQLLQKQDRFLLPVPRSSSAIGRVNADGFLNFRRIGQDAAVNGYVQFYREGVIESVRIVKTNSSLDKVFPSAIVEEELFRALGYYLRAMNQAGIAPPILVGIAYFNVAGYRMAGNDFPVFADEMPQYSIGPNILTYREVLVNEWLSPEQIPDFFQELALSLWNASGYASSHHYRNDGSHPMSKVLSDELTQPLIN